MKRKLIPPYKEISLRSEVIEFISAFGKLRCSPRVRREVSNLIRRLNKLDYLHSRDPETRDLYEAYTAAERMYNKALKRVERAER